MSAIVMTWEGTLRIAGIVIRAAVRGVAPDRIEARYGHFFAPTDAAPDLALSLEVDERHAGIPQPEGPAYPACLGAIDLDGSIRYQRQGLQMRFDPVRAEATGIASPTSSHLSIGEDPTALDTPLRLLVSYALVAHDGFLLHASGFGDDRGAVVFAGVSGGGKTTTARKMKFENVLSDDQVAVRRVNGAWIAHSTPFVGEYGRQPLARVTPLRRVLLLRKGSGGPTLRPLHAALATTRLLQCVPWFVPGAEPSRQLLEMVSDVVARAGVSEIEIGRDAVIVPTLEELLRSCTST